MRGRKRVAILTFVVGFSGFYWLYWSTITEPKSMRDISSQWGDMPSASVKVNTPSPPSPSRSSPDKKVSTRKLISKDSHDAQQLAPLTVPRRARVKAAGSLRKDKLLDALSAPPPHSEWERMKVLPDDEIAVVRPKNWALPRVLLFLHIPKTAGFTVRNILADHMLAKAAKLRPTPAPYDHCDVYCNCITGYNTIGVWSHFRKVCGMYYGHVDFLSSTWLRKITGEMPLLLTFLRHPVKRVISEYNWMKVGLPDHPVNSANLSLSQYALEYLGKMKLDNLMVRMLAGVASTERQEDLMNNTTTDLILSDRTLMLALAKRNLLHFDFVGITDLFTESVELLFYTFNMPTNMTTIRFFSEHMLEDSMRVKVSEEVEQQIAAREDLDMQLYEWAVSIFRARLRSFQLSKLT